MKTSNVFKLFASILVLFFGSSAMADTLSDTKERGHVRCGVSQGLPGFSNPDADGNCVGIDVDVCRAVSAAIFGDADAFEAVPATTANRFTVLNSGEADVLWRNTR